MRNHEVRESDISQEKNDTGVELVPAQYFPERMNAIAQSFSRLAPFTTITSMDVE